MAMHKVHYKYYLKKSKAHLVEIQTTLKVDRMKHFPSFLQFQNLNMTPQRSVRTSLKVFYHICLKHLPIHW